MAMDEKLVERLIGCVPFDVEDSRTIQEAATALTLAQARIKVLETALAFYACDAANCDCLPGEEQSDRVACGFNARQALKEAQP